MNKLLTTAIAAVCLAAPSLHATTWYVRTDGGTRFSAAATSGQCDGRADAAYLGAGKVNQHCAFSSPAYLAYDGTTAAAPRWVIAPGDTVMIHAGQYRVGYRGPNPTDAQGMAVQGDPFQPGLPAIPGGTIARPTTFIGDGAKTTQIFGGYGARTVLDLSSGAFVISGLELTDHGQCRRFGPTTVVAAYCRSDFPLDDYASSGIVTSTGTVGLALSDVNIHGFTSRGIIGPVGGPVVTDHVRIAFNGGAGWDFDDGNGTRSVNATVVNRYLFVVGNGFDEEYPVEHGFPAISGYDQNDAGYGDGIGTPDTALDFACDHCLFQFNTQDGLDLLHVSGSKVAVTNSRSEGNMGQQWKIGAVASVLFQDNLTIHDCNRLSQGMTDATATYNLGLSNFCRAAGDGIALVLRDGGRYVFQSSSYLGYGATTYDLQCASGATCTQPMLTLENMLHVGLPSPMDGQLPGSIYLGDGVSPKVLKTVGNNIFFNFRNAPTESVVSDPALRSEPAWTVVCASNGTCTPSATESMFDGTDFHLTSASGAAIGAGTLSGPLKDYDGNVWGLIRDIGAYKYVSSGPVVPTAPSEPAPSDPTAPTSPALPTSPPQPGLPTSPPPAPPSPLSLSGSLQVLFNADGSVRSAVFTPVP